MKRINILLVLACLFGLSINANAQRSKKNEEDGAKDISSQIAGLSFRHVGPALMSGRVSDIVIHPDNANVWYVAVGSGGVWKTENSGTTWTSLFDGQASYSIGCLSFNHYLIFFLFIGLILASCSLTNLSKFSCDIAFSLSLLNLASCPLDKPLGIIA